MDYRSLEKTVANWLEEDDLSRDFYYTHSLPAGQVRGEIHLKSPMVLSGLPFFAAVFQYLGVKEEKFKSLLEAEGQHFEKGTVLSPKELTLSFGEAVTGERLALNLLQRASSIATTTSQYVDKAKKYGIEILDTRKTTPGLRSLEKYATKVGGASNHRHGQTDAWMIKDNHKSYFGGLNKAVNFFKSQKSFYTPIVVEIHQLSELQEARDLGVSHFLLDNFSPDDIHQAIKEKTSGMTYEVSGGIRLSNLESYLIEGVDAISVGSLTHSPDMVDISFKYKKE